MTVAPAGRWHALGVPLDSLTRSEARAWAQQALASGAGGWVATPNPEIVATAWRQPALSEALSRASLVLPDGIGLVWASRILSGPLTGRIAGIDFLQDCLAVCARQSWPVFLLGARPGVAARAAERLRHRYPGLKISGVHHGYFAASQAPSVMAEIVASAPRFLAVGMGHPRQELWLAANMPALDGVLGLACGGSLDVLAGEVRRAPGWVQRAGLEWLYRICQAPAARLGRSGALLFFAGRVLSMRLCGKGSRKSAAKSS